MHSILFSVTRPEATGTKGPHWGYIVEKICAFAKADKSIQPLGLGAWLFLSADGLPVLGEAIEEAKRQGFAYRVLLIEKAVDWTATPVAT